MAFNALCNQRQNGNFGFEAEYSQYTHMQANAVIAIEKHYKPLAVFEHRLSVLDLILIVQLPDRALYKFIIAQNGTWTKWCVTPELVVVPKPQKITVKSTQLNLF